MLTVTLAGLRLRWRLLLLSAVAVGLGVAFTAATLIYTATVNAAYYSQYAAEAKNVDAAVLPGRAPAVPLSDLAAVRAVPGAAAVEGRLQGPLTLIGAGGRAGAATAIDRPPTRGSASTRSSRAAGACCLTRTPPRSTMCGQAPRSRWRIRTGAPSGWWSPGSPTWALPGEYSAAPC